MKLHPDRYQALKKMDLEYGRRVFAQMRDVLGDPIHGDESILAGMHKARILAGRVFTQQERAESRQWLTDRGWDVPR